MNIAELILSTTGAGLVGAVLGLFVFAAGCLFDGYDGMAESDTLWGNIRWWAVNPAIGLGGLWFVVGLLILVSAG